MNHIVKFEDPDHGNIFYGDKLVGTISKYEAYQRDYWDWEHIYGGNENGFGSAEEAIDSFVKFVSDRNSEIAKALEPRNNFFEDALDGILDDIRDTIICKRHDYGTGNISKFGIMGIMVRASDKLERIINLSKVNSKVKDETTVDTWRDLCGYAIIALLWLGGEYELPNREK